MIANYRKKPVVIEADQLTNDEAAHRIVLWITAASNQKAHWDNEGILVQTLETPEGGSWQRCGWGSWIIKGIAGEFYPCEDSIFKATYDPAQ
jgi:hypothetical protein